MSLIDDIVDTFLGGADNWKERLGDSISLTSPDGDEYTAKWTGDSREAAKKLGIFIYPRIAGNVVQDLDVNSTRYSIPIHFDGDNCDTDAQGFFESAKQRGTWTVEHPTYGILDLQLISLRENNEPVSNGGIVTIDTEWIEPVELPAPGTGGSAGALNGLGDELNASAVDQFVEGLNDATEALRTGIDTFTNGIANLTDAVMEPLFASVDAVNDAMLAINNGIQDTLNATVLQVRSLAGQIQNLTQTPLLADNDINSRLDYYDDLDEEFFDALPSQANDRRRNDSIISELALLSNTVARAKIASSGITAALAGRPSVGTVFEVTTEAPIQTRPQAVEAAQRIADAFDTLLLNMETTQELFEERAVDLQYFSQPQTFSQAAQLVAKTVEFLLISSFDLAIERTIVLDRPRSPVDITVQEYGGLGENDSNLDLFIRSNELSGDEIYMLPAGREILIYA